MHTERDDQQKEKTTYWVGEVVCKWYILSGFHVQMKTYRCPTVTWKDAQYQ